MLDKCLTEATVGTSIAHEQGVSPLFWVTSDYSRGTLFTAVVDVAVQERDVWDLE